MSHIVCLVNVEANEATFTWSEGPASFEPYTLDGMAYKVFKKNAENARQKLAKLVDDCLHDEENVPAASFELAPFECGPRKREKCCRRHRPCCRVEGGKLFRRWSKFAIFLRTK